MRLVNGKAGTLSMLVLSAGLSLGIGSTDAMASSFRNKAPLDESGGQGQKTFRVAGKRAESGTSECGFRNGVFRYKPAKGIAREIGPDKGMLADDEVVEDISCNKKRAFILTDRKWIIVEGNPVKGSDDGGTLKELFYYKDIRQISGAGPRKWIPLEDRIILKTDKIREIPLSGPMTVHAPGKDVRGASVFSDSGLLFIAPVGGKIIVGQIGSDLTAEMDIPDSAKSASFHRKDGRVFLGKVRIDIFWNADGSFQGFRLAAPSP